MSRIKSRDTKFERDFLKLLSGELYPRGFRYRKHYSKLIGKPDIAFVKQKTAVFLDSDFWHGRNYRNLKPKLKNSFWTEKIERNIARDKRVSKELRRLGWSVIRLGEQEVLRRPAVAIIKIRRVLENA